LTSSTLPAGQQAAAIFLLDVLYYKNAFENIDKKWTALRLFIIEL
jgi:hypothetical protein